MMNVSSHMFLSNILGLDIQSYKDQLSYENTMSTRNLMLWKREVQVERCKEIDKQVQQ